jgi:hypothetical protein
VNLVPVTLREASAYIERHHRHHAPPRGCLFCVGVCVGERPCPFCQGRGYVDLPDAESGETCCPDCEGSGDGDRIAGVAVVGRPVARELQDGYTAEVTRVCTDGTRNACSMLYAAAWRACRALGYRRLVTYTLPSEGGASLRGAGWRCIGAAGGGSWDTPSRPRVDMHPTQQKLRWEMAS